MAKKRKNSNYVTEKRELARQEAQRAKRNQQIKKIVITTVLSVAIVAILVTGIILLGAQLGWWDEKPVATEHALITIENYGSIHIELYGEHAPKTVEAFLKLVEEEKYNGITIDSLANGMLGTSSPDSTTTIKGEFSANGFENIVKHEKGVLSMALPNGNDSANGEFFFVTEDSESLDGSYAAFGRITDGLSVIEKIVSDMQPDENGNIPADKQPKITSISVHAHH